MEDEYKSLLYSHNAPLDVIRKCMPQLVRRLDLESVMDHMMSTDLLTNDQLKEYEEKKKVMVPNEGANEISKQLNRWFLRNVVLKGKDELSRKLMMAIYYTKQEVQDHNELVKLLREKLSETSNSVYSSVPMESGAPIKPIPEVSAIANIFPEVTNQSERVVSPSCSTQKPLKSSFTFTMPENKKLRDYQIELASYGIEGLNYVACAPTGTGKTLIASMVVANHLNNNPTGKVLFLVNKVPLAEQQCHEVKNYIPHLRAQFITGDSGTQISLHQLFYENNMIVCTNGVFLNELKIAMLSSSERLSLNNITLLIIDECHNTKKNSPYAMIMEEYIKIKLKGNTKDLPQVMGLTASPGAGEKPQGEVDKVQEHLLNLCALLDAQGGIQVVREHKVELVHYSNQPDFDLLKTSQRSSSDPFLNLLLDTMKLLEQWIHRSAGVTCSHDRQNQGYESWVVSQRQLSEQREGPIERDIRSAFHHLLCYCNALKMYRELNQRDAVTILKEKITEKPKVTDNEQLFQKIFHDFIHKADQIHPVENPMLMRLTELLMSQFCSFPTTRGIVFVTTKDTAQRMYCWLQEAPRLKCVIKPAVVTGQSKEEVGGMTLTKQRSTIEQFRNGQLNLLVSTTVLEEGFDVPACNLIVRYNHVTNEIARVQAHGRARAKDSHCYAIMEMDSPKVLQEQLNKEKGDLTIVALEYLPEGERLSEEINTRQKKLLKERAQQQQLQRDSKMECDQVQLVCKRCDSLICILGDIWKVAESHHVVINNDIYNRCDLKGPNTLAVKGEFEIGQKVCCKACGEEWGVMIKWPCRGMHYPAIKCKYVLFVTPDGAKESYKQWGKIPFIIKTIY